MSDFIRVTQLEKKIESFRGHGPGPGQLQTLFRSRRIAPVEVEVARCRVRAMLCLVPQLFFCQALPSWHPSSGTLFFLAKHLPS